jgi:hypothetical protein
MGALNWSNLEGQGAPLTFGARAWDERGQGRENQIRGDLCLPLVESRLTFEEMRRWEHRIGGVGRSTHIRDGDGDVISPERQQQNTSLPSVNVQHPPHHSTSHSKHPDHIIQNVHHKATD